MLLLLADENFNNHIVRGLLRRNPQVDIVRVQDAGLEGAGDDMILAWAGDRDRLVVTHDVNTLIAVAHDRVALGLTMPGVIAIPRNLPIGRAVYELLVFAECSLEGEWEGQVVYLPL